MTIAEYQKLGRLVDALERVADALEGIDKRLDQVVGHNCPDDREFISFVRMQDWDAGG
jgi:alkyl hydroperoxide reductase subunit AhpC